MLLAGAFSENKLQLQAAKLDPQITQVSPGDIFPFYFYPLSIEYGGEVWSFPITD